MLKRLQELNWVAIAAEIFLIFVGITLALWFENANEARRELDRETSILRELHAALGADVGDIRGNLREDSLTLRGIATVLRHLEGALPYADSLDAHFAQAAGITIFLHNSGAYEHLKVAGIDLIHDDSLRLDVVDYYEHLVGSAKEWETAVVTTHWQARLNPQMLSRFRYRQRKEPAHPLDYEALVHDVEYQNVLRHMSFALAFKDGLYGRVIRTAEALRDRIDAELAAR